MEDWQAKQRRSEKRHRYDLSDYGLTPGAGQRGICPVPGLRRRPRNPGIPKSEGGAGSESDSGGVMGSGGQQGPGAPPRLIGRGDAPDRARHHRSGRSEAAV